MIELVDSLKIAHSMLRDLQKDKRSKKVKAYVKVYDNGREQGYMLKASRKTDITQFTIAFSECRGSDEIVVYHSEILGEGLGNSMSNDFYASKKFFKSEHYFDVVTYIFSLIKAFVDAKDYYGKASSILETE